MIKKILVYLSVALFLLKMQKSEKLCLKWNDFLENLHTAFAELRSDNELLDVTLACEDGTQVETHKVVLASSSPFFMEVLTRNKHPHPPTDIYEGSQSQRFGGHR